MDFHKYLRFFLALSLTINFSLRAQEIDLSGMWRFQLDPMGFGKTPGSELYLDRLAETIMLPGSTDEGGKGIKNNARYIDRLSRKFEYMGMAWYQRDADWQWWDVLKHATAMELNSLHNLTPIIQSIDTYEHNRKLGIAFEANVDPGKLFVLCVDDGKSTADSPAMQQLLHSVKNYVASDCFAPQTTLPVYELDALFSDSKSKDSDTSSSAAVQQLLNR